MIASASCLSLYNGEGQSILDTRPEKLTSTFSLSKYESKSLKSLFPQIIASIIAAAFHIGNGISLAYSAVLIKQLDEPGSEIKTTTSEKSWMASVLIIVVPIGSLLCGFLMDGVGRLNTIKIAAIPGAIGWVMIAMAQNVPVIIIGRLLIGFSSAWGTNPAIVYISEIASTDIRGSLMSVAPTYVSLGMVLTYFLGWIMHWRTLAWICLLFIITPALLCMLIPESPSWLVWKGKTDRAKKSLDFFSKYQPQPANKTETLAELQLKLLQDDQNKKKQDQTDEKAKFTTLKEFMKPTGYKPLIFFIGLFFFQHFSGIYITMFFSIQFIEAAGTKIDPYIASILIGVVRLFMSLVSTFLLKKFGRRTLMFTSSSGMALFMFLSGLFTKYIQEGDTSLNWVPVACILFYVVTSILGMLPIPNMLLAELFPLEIRATGYSIGYAICCILMFAALQSYYTLLDIFNGATHLQWFFSVMCMGALVYSYIFLPETFGVKLTEVSNYFKHRTVYIGHHKKTNGAHVGAMNNNKV